VDAKHAVASQFERLAHDRLAYLDDVEMLFRKRFRLNELRRLQGERKCWWEECKGRDGYVFFYRLVVKRPDQKTLKYLAQLQQQHKGKIFRIDLALDLITANEADAEALNDWLLKHTMLRWRRKGHMLDIENTFYWIEQRKRKRRSNREVVLYPDRESKITGEVDCVHLELRFLNVSACRTAGLSQIDSLLDLDPSEVIKKHLKFTSFDVEAYQQQRVKKAVEDDRKEHRRANKPANEFLDQYRSSIPRRIMSHLKRTQQDRAQGIRNFHPRISMNSVDLDLPKHLEWPIERTGKYLRNSRNAMWSHGEVQR
jgi:hypothetical protein